MKEQEKHYNATHAQILSLLGIALFNGERWFSGEKIQVYKMPLDELTTSEALELCNTIRKQNGSADKWHAEETAVIRSMDGFEGNAVLYAQFNENALFVTIHNVFTDF